MVGHRCRPEPDPQRGNFRPGWVRCIAENPRCFRLSRLRVHLLVYSSLKTSQNYTGINMRNMGTTDDHLVCVRQTSPKAGYRQG